MLNSAGPYVSADEIMPVFDVQQFVVYQDLEFQRHELQVFHLISYFQFQCQLQ